MKNKNFLTEGNDYNKQYNSMNISSVLNNPNIKSYNNNFKISQKAKHINNSFTNSGNNIKNIAHKNNVKKEKENNFSKILKMLDEEVKNSMKYKLEINSLKVVLSSKNKEIQNLNNKIKSLMNNITKLKKDKIFLNQNNRLFYQSFYNTMNIFKQYQNMINVSLPNYSLKDDQIKKNKDIIYTLNILIKIIIDLCNNTNSNISKFNSLKNKINFVNNSFEQNNKKNINKVNALKLQNLKMKKILEQNLSFLKDLRDENYILKNRNLNLEKNINLISKSTENLRKKLFVPIRINYNNNVNKTEESINLNNISINTSKTNKTTTDILIEEFQDKENKIKHLHKIANLINNNNNYILNQKKNNDE